MKIYLTAILLVIVVISCKDASLNNDDNKNSYNSSVEEKFKQFEDNIIVTMNLKISVSDMFQIYYNESNDSSYESSKYVENWVEASEDWQEISFVLPKGIYPNHLRLDLGRNKSAEQIFIRYLNVSYEGQNEFNFTVWDIQNYFRPNNNIETTNRETHLQINFINKEKNFDPYLASNNLQGITNKIIFGL